MQPVSLLICGQVRDRDAFSRDLQIYYDWRDRGLIERIVFSGWTSDMRDHADILTALPAQDIEVILADEPAIRSFGYTLHQAKSLHNGLSRFQPDDWILKSRTDKVHLGFDIEGLVRRITGQLSVGAGSPFHSRIMVVGALLLQPFFLNDMMFAGRQRDLAHLAHHDLWYVRDNCLINTEQILFFNGFRSRCPFSEAFFQVNTGLLHNNVELSRDVYNLLFADPLYQHAMREFLEALDSSFTLDLHTGSSESGLGRDVLSWDDIINCELAVPGMVHAPAIGMRNLVTNGLASHLLALPLELGQPDTLASMPKIGPDPMIIGQMRADLCAKIVGAFPGLLNVRHPDQMMNGIRVLPSRISLVG